MAPPGMHTKIKPATHLSTPEDERLSWPCWLLFLYSFANDQCDFHFDYFLVLVLVVALNVSLRVPFLILAILDGRCRL